MTNPCPFCLGSVVAEVFRSKYWRAIYNRSPVVDGHCLLVPLRHVERLSDLTEGEQNELVPQINALSQALMLTYSAGGFDVALQQGPDAGQSISHLHVHCMPRISGDLESPGEWTQALGIGRALDDSERTVLTESEMTRRSAAIRRKLQPSG